MNQLNELLKSYNSVFKEMDKSYHDAIRAVGLSDGAFWILYALREAGHQMTQSEIISIIQFPPQTINSALTKLRAEGCVEFVVSSDRRKKLIRLTEAGIKLSENTVDKVMHCEMEAIAALTHKEQDVYLELFKKHLDMLKVSLQRLQKE